MNNFTTFILFIYCFIIEVVVFSCQPATDIDLEVLLILETERLSYSSHDRAMTKTAQVYINFSYKMKTNSGWRQKPFSMQKLVVRQQTEFMSINLIYTATSPCEWMCVSVSVCRYVLVSAINKFACGLGYCFRFVRAPTFYHFYYRSLTQKQCCFCLWCKFS